MTTDNTQRTTDQFALIQRAQAGVIPPQLDVCTQLLDACNQADGMARVVRCMALAQARVCPEFRDAPSGGRGRKSPWLEWAKEHYREYESEDHIRQMAQVGSLLIRARSLNPLTCQGVYGLDFSKQYCLSRLPENLLAPFLDKYAVADMDRDAVRRAVNQYLKAAGKAGEEEDRAKTRGREGGKGKPEQLTFLDVLFSPDTPTEEALQKELERRARKTDVPTSWRALSNAFVASAVLARRVAGEVPLDKLAELAAEFREQAAQIDEAIAERSK